MRPDRTRARRLPERGGRLAVCLQTMSRYRARSSITAVNSFQIFWTELI